MFFEVSVLLLQGAMVLYFVSQLYITSNSVALPSDCPMGLAGDIIMMTNAKLCVKPTNCAALIGCETLGGDITICSTRFCNCDIGCCMRGVGCRGFLCLFDFISFEPMSAEQKSMVLLF